MEYNRRKYHNMPDNRTVGGKKIKFDSKKEASRYDELMLMLIAGKIRNLKLQPEFTLQESFTTADGERVQAVRYRADFSYEKKVRNRYEDYDGYEYVDEWETVIEDVKTPGTKTALYLQKRKLCLDKGIRITEV